MTAKRVRLAGALDRLGVVDAILEARARQRFPWEWLTVLTFHRVAWPHAFGFDAGVMDTTPEQFERQVITLQRYFTLVDTRDLDAHRAGAPLPPNPVMISFDDGYRDNHDEALPILLRHHAKAVFFVASGYVADRKLFWWEKVSCLVGRSTRDRMAIGYPRPTFLSLATPDERRQAVDTLLRQIKTLPGLELPHFFEELEKSTDARLSPEEERRLADELVMSWADVRALKAAGMDVQSHTREHRILQTMSEEEATTDLLAAREELESQLDGPVHAVAYPAGRRIVETPGLRRAVYRAGYRLGFSNGTGASRLDRTIDWLDVPRVAVTPRMPEQFFRGCLAIPALAY